MATSGFATQQIDVLGTIVKQTTSMPFHAPVQTVTVADGTAAISLNAVRGEVTVTNLGAITAGTSALAQMTNNCITPTSQIIAGIKSAHATNHLGVVAGQGRLPNVVVVPGAGSASVYIQNGGTLDTVAGSTFVYWFMVVPSA